MLAPAFDVFCEFLYAICDLLLALPRHAFALTQRNQRLADFDELKQATLEVLPPQLPPAEVNLKRMILSCGDASGETHAVRLLEVLHQRHPGLEVSGFGGARLASMQMHVWKPLADLNVMGFKDVAAQLPMFFASVYRFAKEIRTCPPDVVVLVDYPGLNRHLLRIAKRRGVPVVDYIAPQLWAWAPWRVRDFRRADTLLTILPFEQDWYAKHGAVAKFVGHPLADSLAADEATWQPPEDAEWIAILPGSRRREIRENLSLMLAAAKQLQAKRPGVRFVLPHLRAKVWPLLHELLQAADIEVTPAPDHFHAVLRQCSGAWVVSGTASLEVAALQIPSVVVFHMPSRLGAWLASHALTVPFVGAANLIARRCIAPEQIGYNLDPSALCADLLQQLEEPGRSESLSALQDLQSSALAPGTAQRAALAVENTLLPS
ncbi:MAG: lipid-A-disaccharide synthase [Planctomycetota bacterium]|nr:MAG: lipid-A-disaccharide synthase [Planctomycetota bacterium]